MFRCMCVNAHTQQTEIREHIVSEAEGTRRYADNQCGWDLL